MVIVEPVATGVEEGTLSSSEYDILSYIVTTSVGLVYCGLEKNLYVPRKRVF